MVCDGGGRRICAAFCVWLLIFPAEKTPIRRDAYVHGVVYGAFVDLADGERIRNTGADGWKPVPNLFCLYAAGRFWFCIGCSYPTYRISEILAGGKRSDFVCMHRSDRSPFKPLVENTALVTNEALACLTSIIKEEEDNTWTIVSANDETQMGLYHGYHYELISFLREMEYKNAKPGEELNIKIPTDSVYVFVEKVPLDYTEHYERSGQSVSVEGAEKELPNVGGIAMYKGEYRWILMSRLYYWAKEFERLYPTNVSVYCETEDFVCYKIKQNPYRLFNFAIDYRYNLEETGGE